MSRKSKPPESEDEIFIRRYVARTFHCEHCGNVLSSYEDENGIQKITCDVCKTRYVRKKIGRRHMRAEIYAPEWASFDIDEAI